MIITNRVTAMATQQQPVPVEDKKMKQICQYEFNVKTEQSSKYI